MAADDKRLDIPKELIEAAKKKVERRVQKFLKRAGVERPRDPVINRDLLSIACGGWGPILVEDLKNRGFTPKPTGKPRQRAVGRVAWKRLDDVVDQVSVSKADLIRAGLQMIIDKGLPDLSDEELELLLEVEDEQVRFGQKPPNS